MISSSLFSKVLILQTMILPFFKFSSGYFLCTAYIRAPIGSFSHSFVCITFRLSWTTAFAECPFGHDPGFFFIEEDRKRVCFRYGELRQIVSDTTIRNTFSNMFKERIFSFHCVTERFLQLNHVLTLFGTYLKCTGELIRVSKDAVLTRHPAPT